MNILKKLLSRSGKIALSVGQMIGGAAVIGVAGFGAISFLSSPEPSDNAFSLNQYNNSGEVVYVAGANTGAYGGANYGAGADGKGGSYKNISAKNLGVLDRQALNTAQMEYLQDQDERIAQDVAASSAREQAYQNNGAVEGLGMGANEAGAENLLGAGGMASGLGASLANIQGAVSSATEAAAKGKKGKGGTLEKASAASRASMGGGSPFGGSGFGGAGFGGGSGMSAGGTGFEGMSFGVQNSGKNVDKISQQALGALGGGEGSRFKNADLALGAKGKFSSIGAAQSLKGKNSLKGIDEMSNKIAATNTRAANAGSLPFLAGEHVSGGMMITGESVTTGQSQGSADFSSATNAAIGLANDWMYGSGEEDGVVEDLTQMYKEREKLSKMLFWTTTIIMALLLPLAIMITAGYAALPYWPVSIAALILLGSAALICVGALVSIGFLIAEAAKYQQHWGGNPLSTTTYVMSGFLTAALGICWIPAVGEGAVNFLNGVAHPVLTGIGIAGGLAALGSLGATAATSATNDAGDVGFDSGNTGGDNGVLSIDTTGSDGTPKS